MNGSIKQRVIIAEDNAGAAAALSEQLLGESEIDLIGVVESGIDACSMVGKLLPDVVLMDIDLPGMNGIEATRRIKQASPGTQVVIITVYDDTLHMFEAIRAGAMSYLVKGCTTAQILHEIKAVAAGEGSIPPAQVRFIRAEFDRLANVVVGLKNLYTLLTKSEIAVLDQVAQGKTNRQIAKALTIEETTVRGHVSGILRKLHVNSRKDAGKIADQAGLSSQAYLPRPLPSQPQE